MDRYPVVVETRVTHVVWVEAEDAAAAVEEIEDSGGADLDQLTDSSNVLDGDWEVRAPDEFDVRAIQYHEPEPDFHVRTHLAYLRELARAECVAAGHPGARPGYRGAIVCDLCSVMVSPAEVVAA